MNNKNGIALTGDCSSPSGLARKTQRFSFVSNKHCNTTVKTPANAPESKSGRLLAAGNGKLLKADMSAETKALHLLREYGFSYTQQLDWIGKNDKGEWIVVEVKEKELFTPGRNFPHYGAGLNKSQLYLRTQLLGDKGLRTYLLIFAKGTNQVYGAYLDELEKKADFYDTKNGIRIYPISNFSRREYCDG